MRHVRLLIALLLLHSAVLAQTRQISGSVKDKAGTGVPSVTIKVKGKSIQTLTDMNGAFSLQVPSGKVTLTATSVGFAEKTIDVGAGESTITISLEGSSQQLGEVVVTALGISKESKKVGYAVSTVGGEQFNKARETNLALSLSGQVAGLNVHGTSGGPGSSARILLRGLASTTAGAPLFVINGVPMDNTQKGSSGEWGGADMGDGIGNLNPDDIETMTVLKGQAASALYGARASNGVIMITTKSGKKGAFTVDYNMNLMVDKAIDFTDYQYTYGQGQYGSKPATVDEAKTTGRMSWGAKLDGSQVIQFDGKSYAYSAVKDNIKNFYRTGPSLTNTISVSRGSDAGTFRLSLSNLNNESIIRNSGIIRKTVNLNIDQKITPKLSVSVMANYIDQKDKARPYLSDGPLNANNGQFLATNIDQKILAPGYDTATGKEIVFSDDIYVTNPWFVVNQLVNDVDRKRLISAVTTRYNLTDWLYAQGRVGYDLTDDRYLSVTPWGTAYSSDQKGGLNNLSQVQTLELNADGLIGISRKLTSDINLDAAIGANLRKNRRENVALNGGPFVLPYIYSWNNVQNFGRNYEFSRTEVHSAYYTLDFSYKNFLTLSTTGRYDAYSTVANSLIEKSKRNIFTPSVSGSFIFSELADIPVLSYGKVRASYAETSGEPSVPYLTAVYYNIGNTLNGLSTASFSTTLPNALLKPFKTGEIEVGTELKFYGNRIGLDIAYYSKKSRNEIMPGALSSATGYTQNYVATGSTKNSGLELMITGNPVKQKDFNWNVSFNLTTLKNVILETDADGKARTLGTYRPLNANTAFVKGMSGPQIMAYDYKRDSKGQIIVNADGLPQGAGVLTPMGSVLPKVYGGLNNEFTYKNMVLSFLLDYNFGNHILSASNYYAIRRGLHEMTLEGRETGIKTGVYDNGNANTTTAKAQDYYMALAQNVSKVNVLDGDYIKLRQFTLGYTLSQKELGSLPLISAIQVSLVGRNLLTLMKHSGNIDPEAGFSNLINYAGIEGTSLPTTRTYGVNVSIKFK